MPIQHSPPARQTISQDRTQAVITPTSRASLEGSPEVPQLRAPLYRRSSTIQEGRKRAKKIKLILRSSWRILRNFKGPDEDGEEEDENYVEEEVSDGPEGAPDPVAVPQGTGGPTLAQSYQPVSHSLNHSYWPLCGR
ncbi:hypothetical protein O181_032338 [Austropuccinia psidii MF-1]|uniref:Uncharacterized protein n=1 Tax=Austropuccinia psidii MF-1 TaxID=1389203 RepID=A0A9Q3H5F0_9BASI|nr:hypothetical protein [Austropuccinia psidii MF-1]